MFICKTGNYHLQNGSNNQDYGFVQDIGILNRKRKCVCDGCGSGENSEVGAKLFCNIYSKPNVHTIEYAMSKVMDNFYSFKTQSYISSDVKNFACFTILSVTETEKHFVVQYCGDGYIIKHNHDNTIEFEELTDGENPKYLAYNYLDPQHLTHYKDGVEITAKMYLKPAFLNIGVATDGIRDIIGSSMEDEFVEYLKSGKESAIKRLINRNQKHIHDDVTIAM